ncbi:MAG TPA: NAD(P)H-dependent glycerol-3-phosphate dehydrogenase [bacterium]
MTRRHRTTCAVLGDGGWGTTLAIHLHRLGHRVSLWGAFPAELALTARSRHNRRYLPGVRIPPGVCLTPDLDSALAGAGLVVLAVPSQYVRGVLSRVPHAERNVSRVWLSVAKGLEIRTGMRMSQVLGEATGNPAGIAVLSGPSIAIDVARGRPVSVVAAASRENTARRVQRWFAGRQFRVYTTTDVPGVELGGALKNPIAIAAGIGDGLDLGPNAKAALITRGIVEMARLGVVLGARQETFWGLSGLGDLVTTCLSGRNRWLGEQIGLGAPLASILRSTPMVIEGVDTSRAVMRLARARRLELPIIAEVEAILFRGRTPRSALRRLMQREGRPEQFYLRVRRR